MTLRCRTLLVFACLAVAAPLALAEDAAAGGNPAQGHDYPTQGRVEYVLSCMDDNGHDFVNVYKCSCVIDRIAQALSYDDFVEQSTFAKYATLGGEGGAEFRVDRAKAQTKKFLTLQAEAYRACGVARQAATGAPAVK
ncbi:hypothetical protein [Paraburkholderia sp. BL10I2N1]|uniref:hypothetical protein n=1 Tax=Paraburkholderia sp. BL10I2N1 TaxID=1938796 RepID=UPI00105E3D5D|nr:hypothetical protein [Paraburkholderia sp. BL10I2N1]TDN69377.1 hypothetical protein B0G77_2762 [Paraburkholderia sp. BL10I2N1]